MAPQPKIYVTALRMNGKTYARVRDFPHAPRAPKAYFGAAIGILRLAAEKTAEGILYTAEYASKNAEDLEAALIQLGTLEFYESRPKR